MKKTLLTLCFLGTIIVSVFPFRTSCGQVVSVNTPSSYSTSQIQNYLSGVNTAVCGTFVHASSIQIYVH
ncbi:hypothetical protein [Chryseobacterium daeguense]|uniref:hypothetical protein n=1 Tax=Chryseobacterium daeguense TaxID=412438 RepID=UPI0012DC22A1|nr:hypothetical protein [Chryseobacterium daeguense]